MGGVAIQARIGVPHVQHDGVEAEGRFQRGGYARLKEGVDIRFCFAEIRVGHIAAEKIRGGRNPVGRNEAVFQFDGAADGQGVGEIIISQLVAQQVGAEGAGARAGGPKHQGRYKECGEYGEFLFHVFLKDEGTGAYYTPGSLADILN